jgi:hypothetical protein
MSFAMITLRDSLKALRKEHSALHWAATPEDNRPAAAVAAGHFVQVLGLYQKRSGTRHSTHPNHLSAGAFPIQP